MAKLFFYYSAMNAGKTTTLLQSAYNYRERGMKPALFKTSLDTREESGYIQSRIGLKQKCHMFDHSFDFFAYAEKFLGDASCILVDEVQFMKKEQIQQLARIVDELDIPVLAYGLRSNFMGELFEGSQALMTLSDELVELKTICHCGRKATMNARVYGDGTRVREGSEVGIEGDGEENHYVSVCRKHFFQDAPLELLKAVEG